MLKHSLQPVRLLSAAIALALLVSAGHASLVGARLTLRADPDRVPADGESVVAISIEVLDAAGRPVPDGTSVHLVTTHGQIVSPVETIGGLAQTTLTASSIAGTAVVSAMVGADRATIEVEFMPTPGSASPGSELIDLTAEDLSYGPEARLFVATGNARLRSEMIAIAADALEYDLMSNSVRAQGNVVLTANEKNLRGDAVRYRLTSLTGRLLRVSEQPEILTVEGEALRTRPDSSNDPCLWYPTPTRDSETWVRARRAAIYPGRRVVLDHPTFYMGETRVMTLRRHVFDPRFGRALFGNTFGYSTLLGAAVDFPIYYRASGHQVGALHITNNRNLGGTQFDSPWCIGLKEEYIREGRSEGEFTIEDLLHPDRGLGWRHHLRLGEGTGLDLDASTMTLEEGGPRLRSAGLRYSRPLGGGRASLGLSGSDFGTSEHYFGDLSYRFRTLSIGAGVMLSPVLHVRHSRRYSEQEEVLVDPVTGEPLQIARESTGSTTSPGVDLAFNLPSRDLGGNTQLTGSLLTGYAWGLSEGSRGVLDGRLSLVRRFSSREFLGLDYSYSSTPAGIDPSPFKTGRQRISLNGSFPVKQSRVRLNISHELDGDRSFGSLQLSRPLTSAKDALGNPLWSLQVRHFFSRFSSYDISSTRLSLSRVLGRYRASLCYSPQGAGLYESRPWIDVYGYGYTYSGGRKFWIELASTSF